MGADISVMKNRNSYLEDNFRHTIMNNLSPIAFHDNHGENIKLSRCGTVACRAEGFCKGITFSNRPVKVNEYIYIKFLDISTSWSGALRIGFTLNNPATFRTTLPRYACPDLTNKPGNWAKALTERFAKKDSVLFYYVDESGDVHYGIDNEHIGVFFSGVNTSSTLWALLDIYGNTRTVELLAPRSVRCEDPNAVVNVESIGTSKPSTTQLVNSNSIPWNTLFNDINLKLLSFHRVHGKNVILNRNRNEASRVSGVHGLPYLFPASPLKVEEKVIIQIIDIDSDSEGSLNFGITSCDPATISDDEMPSNCDDLLDRPEYWVLWKDRKCCTKNDILVFNINSNGELQFSKNAEPLSTVLHVDHSLCLWFFFELYGTTRQIRLIGSTNVLPVLSTVLNEMSSNSLMVSLPPSKPSDANVLDEGSLSQPSDECVVCYEKAVDCVLYRCGHMCMCYKCAVEISKRKAPCPVCRRSIEDVIKTFR